MPMTDKELQEAQTTQRKKVLTFLENHPAWWNITEISHELNIPRSTVQNAIQHWEQKDQITTKQIKQNNARYCKHNTHIREEQ